MSISSGVGLISGLDFESIITQIASLGRRPIQIIQRKTAVLQTQSEAYGVVSAQLTALRDQARKMITPSQFQFREASVSNASALDISVTDTAAIGGYSVRILQLAQADRLASQGVAALNSSIASGAGAFTIQAGAAPARSYELTDSTTLAELRDMINKDAGSGVIANIINDGSPTNPYRLALTAKNTGAANDIRILANDTTLNFTDKIIEAGTADTQNQFNGGFLSSGVYTGSGSMNVVLKIVEGGAVDGAARFVISRDGGITFDYENTYQASSMAQDVSGGKGVLAAFTAGTTDFAIGDTFRIDAFDPRLARAADAVIEVDGIRVTRAGNTFDDVIEGVTLTAKAVSTAPISVQVQAVPGLVNAEVIQFQNAFNTLINTISTLTAYNADTKVAQPLFGDSATRNIRSALNRIITSPVSGLQGQYTTLASLGLTLQTNGTLGFDRAKMNEALENDLEAVMRIFGRLGSSTSTQVQFISAADRLEPGEYRVSITAPATRAAINGAQGLQPAGLAADENLTFTVGDKTFVVGLLAGDTMDRVVSKINASFASEGVALEARQEGGVLRLQSRGFGSAETFTVVSDQSGATDAQLGIGLVAQTATGTNVQGTINGFTAFGEGQALKGVAGTPVEGLELLITASAPTTATVSYTSGVADQALRLLGNYLDSETGIIQVRQDGIASTIGTLNERIARIEKRIENESLRLRRQFIAMESTLAKYQGVGEYITRALGQLSVMQNVKNK